MVSNPPVKTEEYKRTLDAAKAELETLTEQREAIDERISKLKRAIIALSPLSETEGSNPFGVDLTPLTVELAAYGITDACREVLKSAGKPVTPVEVKMRLVQMNPAFAKQGSLMASIHTVLKRLVPKDAKSWITDQGETVYEWSRTMPLSSLSGSTLLTRTSGTILTRNYDPPSAEAKAALKAALMRKNKK